MDGVVPFAWRSQAQLPGGYQQRPLLLLRLWPRRRRDSLRGAVSPGEVLASRGVAAPMARRGALLHEAERFYRMQLHRHSEAFAYLYQRGVRSWTLIEFMRIGYAPGGCLRGWLTQLGHPLPALREAGLVTGVGYDSYVRRIVFPLEGNLY